MLYVKFIDILTRWEQKYHVMVIPRVGEKVDFIDRQHDYEVVDVIHQATPSTRSYEAPMHLDRVTVLVKPWEPVVSMTQEKFSGDLEIVDRRNLFV